jgi:hypothetical protein
MVVGKICKYDVLSGFVKALEKGMTGQRCTFNLDFLKRASA